MITQDAIDYAIECIDNDLPAVNAARNQALDEQVYQERVACAVLLVLFLAVAVLAWWSGVR